MILSAQSIRNRCFGIPPQTYYGPLVAWQLVIDPFSERVVNNGMSYGLSACGYDLRLKDGLRLKPGDFVLATTVERLCFPTDLRGVLADKSTWARRGLAVQNTRFEPGWRGYPTVEISNHGAEKVFIPAGAPIAQMEFELLDRHTSQPYAGKYQDQPQRPVGALLEKDQV